MDLDTEFGFGSTVGAANIDVLFNSVLEGSANATIPLNVNLTDGVSDIVPTSVGLVGNTLTITLPASSDVDIEINGIPFDTITAPATIDIPVINSVPASVGTIVGTDIIVGDSSAVIKDSVGTTLKTEAIPAEASENITINNSTVNIRDTAANLLHAVSVRAEATTTQDIADTTVENSDATYSVDVLAEGSLVLPDSQINVNSVDSGDVVSVKTIDVNLEDSLGAPVVPTSVGLVGNTLTIEVPSGATPMNVDFSADKLTALLGEDITFTDLSDQSPTHWSWRFSDGTTSIVQNPVKSFLTLGFKNVTLLAGKIGAGGVNVKNSYIEILAGLLLDAFPNAAGAYSLRKLRFAYLGSAIRVRRSSDNTEQDIGFNGSNGLDTTALLAFVGAGNGFVTTWYDQSGNGINLTQTTASLQPQIVDSGNVITSTGIGSSRPTLRFGGTRYFTRACFTFTDYSIFNLQRITTITNPSVAFQNGSTGGWGLNSGSNLGNQYSLYEAGVADHNFGTTNTSLRLISGVRLQSSTLLNAYINSTLFSLSTSPVVTPTGSLGVGAFPNGTLPFFGEQSELIFYSSNQSSNIVGIQTNINDYYNVF